MTAGYSLCAVLLFMLALSVAIHRLIVYKQRALTWFLSLVLRALAALLRTFYVSVLAVFVTLFACTPQRVLASNPAQACVGSSSSNIHMAGGVVFALLAAGIAALLALSGATPSMLSRDLLAAASSSSLLLIQGLNTSIVLAALLFPYNLPLQSLLLLLLFTARLWVALRRLPFHAGWVNVVFVGGAAAQAYASLLYIIRVNGGSASGPGTTALMYGLPVAFATGSAAAGGLLARARAVGKRYVAAARDALEQQQQQATGAAAVVSITVPIEFADPNAPLITARIVRGSPDPLNRDLAVYVATEAIFMAALRQFPASAELHAAFAGHLAYVVAEPSRAKVALERARSCTPSLGLRFVLLQLREALQSAEATAGDGDKRGAGMDLVRPRVTQSREPHILIKPVSIHRIQAKYVEFQRTFKLVVQRHRAAVAADRQARLCRGCTRSLGRGSAVYTPDLVSVLEDACLRECLVWIRLRRLQPHGSG